MSRGLVFRALASRVLVICGLAWWGGTARAQHGPTPVVVAPIRERSVPASIRVVGSLLADRSAVVASEVAGVVAEFAAAEGQALKAGDVICRLDDESFRLRLEEARARLGQLRSKLEELENGTRPEELKRAAAAVEEAQAVFEKWQFERNRVQGLAERGQSNPKETHDTEMEYLASRRRLAQEQAIYERWRNGPRPEEIAAARYEVEAQGALVRRLERDLRRTAVAAPFDGRLVAKRTEVGEWIETGGPVCEMVATATVKARLDVPEGATPHARVGEPASVEVEALGVSVTAPIARVIPRAAPGARTFPIEIDLPNPEQQLLPGMFVRASVPAGPAALRLMVSKDAIVSRGRDKTLFVVRDGPSGPTALPVAVETGIERGGEVEVTGAGLAAGELAVVRGNERLFGSTPVVPQAVGDGGSAGVAAPSGPQAAKATGGGDAR